MSPGHHPLMFALSTHNNNPLISIVMNVSFSSFLAVAFACFSFNAAASTTTSDADFNAAVNTSSVQLDLVTNAADGAITMEAAVLLPDGTVSKKTRTFRSMQDAVNGYVRFISTLPYGSTLIRVQFTDANGQLVFAAQG